MITGSAVLAWVQAPHWGEKEKKIGVGEKHKSASETSREVVWGGDSLADIFLIWPLFLPFSPNSETGPRLPPPFLPPVYPVLFSCLRFLINPRGPDYLGAWNRLLQGRCFQSHGILPTNSRTLFAPFFPSKENMFSGHRYSLWICNRSLDVTNCTESRREKSCCWNIAL